MRKNLSGTWITPIGNFTSLSEAAKALQVVKMTVRNRCLKATKGYGFKPSKGNEKLHNQSKIVVSNRVGRPKAESIVRDEFLNGVA